MPTPRVVQLTDWLPPEFSAVSQYALVIAERAASDGAQVAVVGLTSSPSLARVEEQEVGAGRLRVVATHRARYEKESWLRRLLWSLATNLILIGRSWGLLRRADIIRFTGSPPFLLHFVSAANLLLRKRLVYRITDFYPECIIAAVGKPSLSLELARKLTNFLRRRVHEFEVIGNDMRGRLLECGVSPGRIKLVRDGSPVEIPPGTLPLPRPPELEGRTVLLYSGNWGVAHDVDTFFDGYRSHHTSGTGAVGLWLNATGSGADEMERRLRADDLPFIRQKLVPLEDLARLLVTPDAHLITLKDSFSGYVLPSKVYGCLSSGRAILYVGPESSDVHELSLAAGVLYRRASMGNPEAVHLALDELGSGRWRTTDVAAHPSTAEP